MRCEVGVCTRVADNIPQIDAVRWINTYCCITCCELSPSSMSNESDVFDRGEVVLVGKCINNRVDGINRGGFSALRMSGNVSGLPGVDISKGQVAIGILLEL